MKRPLPEASIGWIWEGAKEVSMARLNGRDGLVQSVPQAWRFLVGFYSNHIPKDGTSISFSRDAEGLLSITQIRCDGIKAGPNFGQQRGKAAVLIAEGSDDVEGPRSKAEKLKRISQLLFESEMAFVSGPEPRFMWIRGV